MSKNLKISKKWKIFFIFLGLANLITVIFPILLTLWFVLFLEKTLTDEASREAAGMGFGLLIAFLAFFGVFVLIANLIIASILLKNNILSKRANYWVKAIRIFSILIPCVIIIANLI